MIAEAAAAACLWTHPGAAPYRGPVTESVAAAVARYGLPDDVQAALVGKVRRLEPDALVTITREGLHTSAGKAANLRDMHWRRGMCAGPVDRSGWRDDQAEAAFVYCARGHCIAVPIVCGNVSRIDFVPRAPRHVPFRAWEGDLRATPRQVVHQVPEPSTLALAGLGVVLALWLARRRPGCGAGS